MPGRVTPEVGYTYSGTICTKIIPKPWNWMNSLCPFNNQQTLVKPPLCVLSNIPKQPINLSCHCQCCLCPGSGLTSYLVYWFSSQRLLGLRWTGHRGPRHLSRITRKHTKQSRNKTPSCPNLHFPTKAARSSGVDRGVPGDKTMAAEAHLNRNCRGPFSKVNGLPQKESSLVWVIRLEAGATQCHLVTLTWISESQYRKSDPFITKFPH